VTTIVTVRPARADELETVASLWQEAAAWLAERGLDQWQYPPRHESIARNIAAGDECWLAEHDGQVVATITLDRHADLEFWQPEDDPDAALYVHRMVVARSSAGLDLGSALLDWACRRTAAAGKRWVRLDAWRTNPGLHRYYEGQGFSPVRIVDLAHRGSGALYQRPADTQLGRGPLVQEVSARQRDQINDQA
jgi:GNAT superfamily N-acetyltransferase